MRWLLLGMAAVALGGAAVLVAAPRGEIERTVELVVVPDDGALSRQIVVDTDRGEIRSASGHLTRFVTAPSVQMSLRGESGGGVVAITVVNPEGALHISELVGPDRPFDLSTLVAPEIDVTLTATPPTVTAPGAPVVVRLELILRRRGADPVLLTAAETPSAWTPGLGEPDLELPVTFERLATLGTPSPEGCGAVLAELPVRLEPDVPLACTFLVDVTGDPGDEVVGDVDLVVEVADEAAEIAGTTVTIPVTAQVDGGADLPGATQDGAAHEASAPRDPPLHGVLAGDAGGQYVVSVVAQDGSAGFTLRLGWFEPAWPVGALLAGVWLAAGAASSTVVLMTSRRTRTQQRRQVARPAPADRAAAAGLGLAGSLLVVGLWLTADRDGLLIVGGAHDWYWTPAFPALGIATLLLLTLGFLVASPGVRRSSLRWLGRAVLAVGLVAAAVAILAGFAGFAFGSEGGTSFYAGDYLLLAAHLQMTVLAGALLGAGALLHGMRPRPDGLRGRDRQGGDQRWAGQDASGARAPDRSRSSQVAAGGDR
jgi:hypothetical protein